MRSQGFWVTFLLALTVLVGFLFWPFEIKSALPTVLYKNMPYVMSAIYGLSLFVTWLYRKPMFFFLLVYFSPIMLGLLDSLSPFTPGYLHNHQDIRFLCLFFLAVNAISFSLIINNSVINRAAMKWWLVIVLQWFALYIVSLSNLTVPDFLSTAGVFQGWREGLRHSVHLDMLTIEVGVTMILLLYLIIYLFVRRLALDVSMALLVLLMVIALTGDDSVNFVATIITVGLLFFLCNMVFESYRLAYFDELTRLPSRRALQEAVKSLGSRYVIAMLDIDHFKRINDRHGHDVGDQVLRFTASRIIQNIRGGRAFRYGGEEFMLVYPGKELDQIKHQLEAIRESIEHSSFNLRGKSFRFFKNAASRHQDASRSRKQHIQLTVSIGAAERNGEDLPAEVMKRADDGVYKAKNRGRNRVVISG